MSQPIMQFTAHQMQSCQRYLPEDYESLFISNPRHAKNVLPNNSPLLITPTLHVYR